MYEIMLERRTIKVDFDTWYRIRNCVRNHKWFYVMYQNKKYKYVDDQTFYDRSTRFDFELVADDYEEEIEIIYVD